MELHVYSPIAGSPTVDPASLAAVWLAERSSKPIAIYASGNTHVSPTNTLPALLDSVAEPISGYIEIASRLQDSVLSPLEVALIAYCQELAVFTQWTLFVLSDNYEGLTRPEISAAIPFPMQYNAALSLRRRAQAMQPITKRGGPKQPEEALNKLHKAMLEKNKELEKAQQVPKETLRRMVQITEVFNTITPLLDELPADSPAALLVAANLVLLTMPRLPVRPLAPAVEENPKLKELRDYGRALNFRLSKIVSPVPTEKAYTLWNTISAYLPASMTSPRPGISPPVPGSVPLSREQTPDLSAWSTSEGTT